MSKVAKSFICRGCLNPVTSAVRTSVDIGASATSSLARRLARHLLVRLSVSGTRQVGCEIKLHRLVLPKLI